MNCGCISFIEKLYVKFHYNYSGMIGGEIGGQSITSIFR